MNHKLLLFLLIISQLSTISCERYFGERTWACYNELGCDSWNPWGSIENGNTESTVIDFLEDNNVHVFDIKIEVYSNGPFCMACSCPTGRAIKVLVLESDIKKIKDLGFYQ